MLTSTLNMDDTLVETGSTFPVYLLYIALGIFAFVVLVVVIWKIKKRLTQPEMYGLSRAEIQKRWATLKQTSQQGNMGAKLAIMEADMLLDSALKSMSMSGTTLGERLKFATYKYPKLNGVWWAHKLRNQLVHEASFNLSSNEARRALDEFESALKILNVL